jgi:hypothetical protein
VTNNAAGPIKFNIINLIKGDSLYNEGMQPAVWSQKKNRETGIKWFRDGTNISYKGNKWPRYTVDSKGRRHTVGKFCTLTFTYEFHTEKDTVYFAHCYPYTYSKLRRFVEKVEKVAPKYCRVDELCRTLAGNSCYMMTITSQISSYKSFTDEKYEWSVSAAARRFLRARDRKSGEGPHDGKKVVVISARVHPGETNSSYVM